MIVTFISQCEKNALKKTRRVLDAFADRIGDKTWQTIITDDGLNTVKNMLRQTVSKSTAVSCHWIRSRSRSQFLWIVGNKDKFSNQGLVPVNSTRRNIRHVEWESHWQHGTSIQIIAVIAALLHDIGKATIGFQQKLKPKSRSKYGDPYRHEWISLRLFQAMIYGCNTDEEWLNRLANFNEFMQECPDWLKQLGNDDTEENIHKLDTLPPLAQLIAWLIATHHRLPFYTDIVEYRSQGFRKEERCDSAFYLENSIEELYKDLSPVNGWVKNNKSCEERDDKENFWCFKAIVMESKSWQKNIKRWANKALRHVPLLELAKKPIGDPFVLYLARLCVMVGDHNYSSQPASNKLGDKEFKDQLAANTDRKTGEIKQSLDEHLIGVGNFTARFSNVLPQLAKRLPPINEHKLFSQRTSTPRFQWQNKSYALAKKCHEASEKQGFFGVNMASTGCGKTLGNARIMYALSGEKEVRFTIALGLRILTLQTGLALREKLNLDDSELAILVGGSANRILFELNQSENETEFAASGSESLESLVKEKNIDFLEDGIDESELGTIVADEKARKLLYAPIVSCTVDHIMSASENLRGGRHIAPILRLLSSDLILDEPDDFSQEDLPALSRLVHLAGLFGSRLLLSSATLTPDFIAGLFKAYQEGRNLWNQHMGLVKQGIVCAWFDEKSQKEMTCGDAEIFYKQHQLFAEKRAKYLQTLQARRTAEILPMPLESGKFNMASLAKIILKNAQRLHEQHHELNTKTNKTASIGLVRFANIRPLVQLTQALYAIDTPLPDVQVHICCYHARQLLLLRSSLENKLDRILNRNNNNSLFDHPEISEQLNQSDARHHIFIVLATPVAEVGRDHDYDWAIIEPSSMRSIIQLAGRIWRHRPDKLATSPNILIMDANVKALEAGPNLGIDNVVFARPGFEESPQFMLSTHRASELLTAEQLMSIDAVARIVQPKFCQKAHKLADLEHAVMLNLLNNPKLNFVNAFWQENTANRACAHLPLISPFRQQKEPKEDYVCLPDDNSSWGFSFKYSEKAWADRNNTGTLNQDIQYTDNFFPENSVIQSWLTIGLQEALRTLASQLKQSDLTDVALRYATVQLNEQSRWCFHPWLGFWLKS